MKNRKAQITVERKELFICDPEKNSACSKRGCVHNPNAEFHQCSCTTNPAFARLDNYGEPMKAQPFANVPRPGRTGVLANAKDA